MSDRKRRTTQKSTPQKCVPTPQKPCPTTTPNGGTRQFGTSAGDQENHVNVPPEMMQDLHGNDFIRTMLG